MRTIRILACFVICTLHTSAGPVGRVDLAALQTPIYTVEGDAFVRHNGDRFGNRPIYANQISAVVLAGDKPYLRFGENKQLLGNFMLAFVRQQHGKWLHDCSDITSRYRPGRMEWTVRDNDFGATTIELQVVPLAEGAGLALRANIKDAQPGDELIWANGAARQESQSVLWAYDVTTIAQADRVKKSFVPEECHGNHITLEGNVWKIQASANGKGGATGHCSVPTSLMLADAAQWKDPVALLASQAQALPMVCGSISVATNSEIFWVLQSGVNATENVDCAAIFAAGLQRVERIEKQVVVETPDAWLNAAVGASCNVMDAVFRNGMFTHAGMRWGEPLLGWRTQFGGTVYGWHDRVLTEAKYCLGKQITESDKLQPQADEKDGLACQSPDSRLFGKGRVNAYQPWHYDMQSQFFDQLVHAWHWTGGAALGNILRPALELHLEYIRDCFDPDGDGIYESYANSWPTDDQWYNGGGTAEETAYAYNSEKAALQFARLAGDEKAIAAHQAQLDKIRRGFFDLLWIPASGHAGAYREQLGYKRLHECSWLYSTFCPIDAGLLDTEQAAQALNYTEWGLERIQMPYGGEQCWPSSWVPSIWSVREMWPGDNYQLALAYFQTGLGADGWRLLHGTFPEQMFFGRVPGDLGHPAGATDFNDCASMFCRTVVEGLFGFVPDYPDGIVKISPQFPTDWDHASIRTPDVKMSFQQKDNVARYEVELTRPCAMNLVLPVHAGKIRSVSVNGRPADWKLDPGFGQSLVNVKIPEGSAAVVELTSEDTHPVYEAAHIAGNSGESITLAAADAPIIQFHDPQGVLQDATIVDGKITGTLTTNAGNHLVFALAQTGDTQQWREFKIKVTDTQADAVRVAKQVQDIPANAHWDCVDLQTLFNGDIRTIYKQKYLSPRPNTCSLRIAEDGYSTWQMMLEKNNHPPEINLDNVPQFLAPDQRLVTAQGVPFHWSGGDTNIAFTSQWDNWPRKVTATVNRSGDAIWFLVCGSSNPMQVQIANAELRMKYADGVVEKLELVPPFNFWSLCPLNGFDYNYERDAFCLPKTRPPTVQLGKNCRAMLLNWRLRPGVKLESVTLETLSQEVVIGLMGLTVMTDKPLSLSSNSDGNISEHGQSSR